MDGAIELERWHNADLPRVRAGDWDPSAARLALAEIRRLRGLLDAAQAVLVSVMSTATGRDTKATLVRELGLSSAQAGRAFTVASVVGRVPLAAELLASGDATAEHLRHLAPIEADTDAAELLEHAPGTTPDDYATLVERFRIDQAGDDWRTRQRASRSVRWFRTNHGCVGLRAVLPPVEGEHVRAALNAICDANWRAEHPDRAPVLGGHDGEPREQRLADALVQAITGKDAPAAPATRIGLVVTIDADTLDAELLGTGPIASRDALDLADDPRTELFAAIRETTTASLHFGRNRRLASPLQRLAIAIRDNGRCTTPGCTTPWTRCDADHIVEWEHGGPTDTDNLRLLCPSHHAHRHQSAHRPHRTRTAASRVRTNAHATGPP